MKSTRWPLNASALQVCFGMILLSITDNSEDALLQGDVDSIDVDAGDVDFQNKAIRVFLDVRSRYPVGGSSGTRVSVRCVAIDVLIQMALQLIQHRPRLIARNVHGETSHLVGDKTKLHSSPLIGAPVLFSREGGGD